MYVYDVPYVVIWVDTCSEEYALAVERGEFVEPVEWEGYPVIVRYTCGLGVDVEDEGFIEVDEPYVYAGLGSSETGRVVTGLAIAAGVATVVWLGVETWLRVGERKRAA